MPNFTAGTSFTDGVTNDVTAAKLNALVADAVPTSSLSLNSTTGTISQFSSGTGTAASPAIQPTGDTNTGIFFPAADTIAFSEGGTESMRIDSSGRVGIGSTSPQDKLDLGNPSGGLGITWGGSNGASRYNSIFSSYSAAGLVFSSGFHGSASADSYISSFTGTQALAGIRCDSFGATAGNIKFFTDATASRTAGAAVTPTERLRIDSSGNVGIGETSILGRLSVKGSTATSSSFSVYVTDSAGSAEFFVRDDGLIGTGVLANSPYNFTTANAANCNIGTNGFLGRSTSSIKYKKDISNLTHGLTEVLKLRPVTYKGKSEYDGTKVFGGLIAEEVHDAGLTEFVQYAEDGSPDSLSYGNMVSLAFKAIQELKAENNSLKSRIEALEAK